MAPGVLRCYPPHPGGNQLIHLYFSTGHAHPHSHTHTKTRSATLPTVAVVDHGPAGGRLFRRHDGNGDSPLPSRKGAGAGPRHIDCHPSHRAHSDHSGAAAAREVSNAPTIRGARSTEVAGLEPGLAEDASRRPRH
jgi:hypothetical protein